MTVNWVRCSGPITNTDFLCRAVRSTRGDRTLCPEYSLQTRSRFLTSRHLHSLLPHDAYAWTELLIIHSLFLLYTFDTRMLSIVWMYCFKSYLTMQLPSTSWSCCTSQSMLWNIHICYWQNRLSHTRYLAYAFHYYHHPCIPAGRGSAMSLRDSLVSGEFLVHLAHLFWKLLFVFVISSVSHSNFYLSKRIVFNNILLTYFHHKRHFH